MRGYTTNFVNLIADNLRDRYDNGFPILKELIQNADDAKARRLIFGTHSGFADSQHPLLQGSGLWFFNDGEFKENDAENLRSFGIGGKAGDANAIGSFGLGMKSVFHLCEALFYLAWNGERFHCEGLTPWKQDGHDLQKEWENTTEADWGRLKNLGNGLIGNQDKNGSWFLLWIPLRAKIQLLARTGQAMGAIISRFPGDDPESELAFLNDEKLPYDMAEMLPLLRHLKSIEYRGANNRIFLQLSATSRLMNVLAVQQTKGQVVLANGRPLLWFSAKGIKSKDDIFARMRTREEWPRIWYRDELGHERQTIEKASPEAAVLFCSGSRSEVRSRLQWAVFLPVDYGGEVLPNDSGEQAHSLVLHGQFFLDAGRKQIYDLHKLHEAPVSLNDGVVDESLLRRSWNQSLAQEVLLPLVLPALRDHTENLREEECSSLTKAISSSAWFARFRSHVCWDRFWLRCLTKDAGPKWRLVEGAARSQLRPFPKPPITAPERPWKVFLKLNMLDVVPYDAEAPRLCPLDKPGEWKEQELRDLLSHLEGMFSDPASMDYVVSFLDNCAGPHLTTDQTQLTLINALRLALRAAGLESRRKVLAKARRLVGHVEPKRRIGLAAELPEAILDKVWEIDAPVLLVPKGMDPESPGIASPDKETLAAWLGTLDHALSSPDEGGVHRRILQAVQGLLQTLSAEDRGRFLREHRTLRVIGVLDTRSEVEKPVSVEYIKGVSEEGCLFAFAGELGRARMGLAPLLARVMPDTNVCLVHAQTYRDILSEDDTQARHSRIPTASDGCACLAAVSRYSGRLGSLDDRHDLLERANDPGIGTSSRRGLRFLLHGSLEHRDNDDAVLWIGRHDQHSAWRQLWSTIHSDDRWSLVNEKLAGAIPRSRWHDANIKEFGAHILIDALHMLSDNIVLSGTISVVERNEILSHINDEELWRRVPLHTNMEGNPIAADGELVYMVPRTGFEEDPLIRRATLIPVSRHPKVDEQQRRWLRPLDDRARIEIALSAHNPSDTWRSVMDALDRLQTPVDQDLRLLLMKVSWLLMFTPLSSNPRTSSTPKDRSKPKRTGSSPSTAQRTAPVSRYLQTLILL